MSTEQIKLTVNPAKRVLEYSGIPLLGVVGDDCAQRIFFECPKSINEFIDDMTSDNITVFIDYKNAYGEPYIQECAKPVTFNESTVTFSWVVTKFATAKAGNVSFNVCVKKTVDGVLENEWHTTDIQGKVLPKVDTSNKTLEVITHDTVTVEALTLEVSALKSELINAEQYISDEVSDQLDTKLDTKLDEKLADKLPVTTYVTGNNIFTTDLLSYDNFTMFFKVSKASSSGISYLYHSTEAGKYTNILGFVTYGDSNGYMHYTIRGTRINKADSNNVYMLEIITSDTSKSKDNTSNDIPDTLANNIITVVDNTGLFFSISESVSDAYLVAKN